MKRNHRSRQTLPTLTGAAPNNMEHSVVSSGALSFVRSALPDEEMRIWAMVHPQQIVSIDIWLVWTLQSRMYQIRMCMLFRQISTTIAGSTPLKTLPKTSPVMMMISFQQRSPQPAEANLMNAICDDVNLELLEQGLTSAKALDEDDGLFCDAAQAELLAEPIADGLSAEQINGQMFVSTYSRINIVKKSSIWIAYRYKQKSLEELFAVHATSVESLDPPTLYRTIATNQLEGIGTASQIDNTFAGCIKSSLPHPSIMEKATKVS